MNIEILSSGEDTPKEPGALASLQEQITAEQITELIKKTNTSSEKLVESEERDMNRLAYLDALTNNIA